MIRRILLGALAFVLLSAAPAHAQYFQVTMTIDSEMVPGQTVTVTVTSFAPGTEVDIQILPNEVNIGVRNPGTGDGGPTTTAGPTTTTTTTDPTSTTTEATTTTTTTEPTTTTAEPTSTTTEATTTTTEPTTTTTEPTTTTTWPRPPWWGGGGWWGGWWPHGDDGNGGDDMAQSASWKSNRGSAGAATAQSLGKVRTDASGKASAELPVPAGVEKGKALVAAHGVVADGSEQVVKSETLVTDQLSAGIGESASGGVSQGVTYVPTASGQPADRDLLANPLGVVGTVGVLVAGSLFLLSRRHRGAGSLS